MPAIDAEVHHACCEVVYRVAIHIRAFSEIERRVVYALMDATHNIPLFLQTGDADLGSQVQWDIDRFDERYADADHSLSLRQAYDDGIAEFRSQ